MEKTAASRPPKQLLQPSRGRCNTTLRSVILLTRTLSLCFFSQAVLKTAELVLLLQPAMRGQPSSTWAASSFLSSFLHIHPSSCFLTPRSFRFLVPAVLLFGLILQLHNFKLFFCVLAEERLIHLCSSSHLSLLLFSVFECVGTTWRNRVQPAEPKLSPERSDVCPAHLLRPEQGHEPCSLRGWRRVPEAITTRWVGMREDGRGYSTCGTFGDLSSPA